MAAISASAWAGLRTLCAQLCTVVMPLFTASASARSTPIATSAGVKWGDIAAMVGIKPPFGLRHSPRAAVFHICQWVSTKPGIRTWPDRSITSASPAGRPGPIASIRPWWISRSVFGRGVSVIVSR